MKMPMTPDNAKQGISATDSSREPTPKPATTAGPIGASSLTATPDVTGVSTLVSTEGKPMRRIERQ